MLMHWTGSTVAGLPSPSSFGNADLAVEVEAFVVGPALARFRKVAGRI